jgi:asparagine synthetase B (glutamine-hydrolysing)
MCGIFGLVATAEHGFSRSSWEAAVSRLFVLSESRGKEAAGIAIATSRDIVIHKDSIAASAMLRTAEYAQAVERGVNGFFRAGQTEEPTLAAIGHSRLVTNGLQGIEANNQPVWRDDVVLIHNGIVVNVDELWRRQANAKPNSEVDTEVIAALVQRRRQDGADPIAALCDALAEVEGEASVAMFLRDADQLLLATNTGSLFVAVAPREKALFFASEDYICRQLTNGQALQGFEAGAIEQINAGAGVAINLSTLEREAFSFGAKRSVPANALNGSNSLSRRRIEDNAARTIEKRASLRRCSRCILPETMPYIMFDQRGVCNYCHNYEPVLHDSTDVESQLAPFRKPGGKADCIVAFSGGRDSSYGLHLLKAKFGMNPIAYTYDWGMVTDLARRNQARMCGKLGIEHIWVSANIKAKRANIRRNVEAWLHKPDLGIIPLFMAGDKQFFWYANKTMQQTGVPLMVFCTNNLEKTDFKTGFLGVAPKDSRMRNRPTSMALADKASLLWGYGSRFVTNPRYLNRSVFDTAWAYWSYYVIKQDHLFLFDHIKWDEEEVNRTLIDEYNWERATDTDSTWRIGDGTAPFYNYIYLTVAGFTEYDTFRSNQVREGQITREQALAMAARENVPRWKSIREYFQMINVNFDDAIRVIDRIPKLYA